MPTDDSKKLQILLAEDDPDDSLLFTLAADVLTTPVQISLVENGEMLLKYLDREPPPELIFMDLNMPRKSGLECLKLLRNSEQHRLIPVVIYSTADNETQIDLCFKEKANLYAIKPTSFQSMIKLLKKIISMDYHSFPIREQFLVAVS